VSWERIGEPSPDELEGSRVELHYAAQLPAAVGVSVLEPQPDFSHHALYWDDDLRALMTPAVPGSKPYRVGLRFADLHLFVVDDAGNPAGERGLVGQSVGDGLRWLAGAIADHTGDLAPELGLPEHDMPEHPLGSGEPFSFREPDQFEELARWFANAERVLQLVRENNPGASPVQVWPHHFDMATLIKLDPKLDPEEARTIGVGLSPGDGSYDEPYFYVAPWPYPEAGKLPALTAGGWHTAGWTGAVLRASELVELPDQQGAARTFLGEAVRAARSLLG